MTDIETSNPNASAPADHRVLDYDLYERRLIEARHINKDAVFAILGAAGITHVIVDFDGYGDSGQIQNVETKSGDVVAELPAVAVEWTVPVWNSNDMERSNLPLRDAIERLVYSCLEETHMGWENNDGAYGYVTFDVTERSVTLDYNERYTASDYFQHVF